jgi:regulator of protease activity HflC (stomatin/prohibitin superfamily)
VSQLNGTNSPSSGDAGGTILAPAQRRGRRGVTLRGGADASAPTMNEMMDPASKSLADALRMIYRVLLIAMVVIVAAYFLSGFKRVNESESGVRTMLGKITARDIPPGFAAAFPEPIGELVRVQTGAQNMRLNKQFFPRLSENEEKAIADGNMQPLADGGSNALDPDSDGALITGDGNLVHARVTVLYRRANPSQNILNIADDDADGVIEKNLVTAAARRGMVHAAARVSIDEFLKNQADSGRADKDVRSVDVMAKAFAQEMLDKLNAGIEIQQLSVNDRIPPRMLIKEFNKVQSAQSTAAKSVSEAEEARKERLNQSAGESAGLLLAQIDDYDRLTRLGDQAAAALVLAKIHSIMLREQVTIDGVKITPNTFGKVSQLISDANRYRTEVVGKAQASASLFEAKRAAFASNPDVMVVSEWATALKTFMTRPGVQVMMLPPSAERTVVQLNRDPQERLRLSQEAMEKEAREAMEKREADRRRENFERKLDATGSQ